MFWPSSLVILLVLAPTGCEPSLAEPTVGGESVTQGNAPTSDVPPALEGLSAGEVAQLHYNSVYEGDRETWVATLSARNREMADRRGSSPDFWWDTGRRYATRYGVYYRFRQASIEEPEYQKLFFDRLNADGSRRGRPVPIHMVLEDDGWRVKIASY